MDGLYSLVDSGEFIEIAGVGGTPAFGVLYSLSKDNIRQITKDVITGNIIIGLLTDIDIAFLYTQLLDPYTGLPFATLDLCEERLQSITSYASESRARYIVSEAVTIGVTRVHLLPTASSGYLVLKSPITNTNNITIGNSTVMYDTGFTLEPGDSQGITHSDLSRLYAISDLAGQTLYINGSTVGRLESLIGPLMTEDGDLRVTELDEFLIQG